MKREFSLNSPNAADYSSHNESDLKLDDDEKATLLVHYKAITPRMLRVAVNGFFESLGVIVQVMEELDVDVVHEKGLDGLEGIQGLEQGMTGSGVGAGT